MTHFRQCKLHRGAQRTVSWLPERFARQGRYLKLKTDGEWQDGWRVMAVGSQRMTEQEVNERSQDYKHQREASDI